MTTSVRVLVPTEIKAAMIVTGTTIAEPDLSAGESAWVASAVYAVNDEKTYSGSVWACVQAHTGRTALPPADGAYWLFKGPTNRMAPFDDEYSTTKARAATALTYVIRPGFLNGLALYGLEGISYSITVKDAPGGTVIKTWAGDLFEQAAGFYELLYTPLLPKTQLSFDDVPLAPNTEVSITITAGAGQTAAVGTIKVGDWMSFVGMSFGGAQYGAKADRNSYSFRKYNDDGTYRQVIRPSSRNVNCNVIIDAEQAMYADAILGRILDTMVPFEGSGLPRYGYLNTLGLVSGSIQADTFGTTSLNLTVKGSI